MTHPPTSSDDERLHLEVRVGEDQASIRLSGDMAGDSVIPLADEINRLVATWLHRSVALDTSAVRSCDDAALPTLLGTATASMRNGCDIQLTVASIAVREALDVTAVDAHSSIAQHASSGSDEGASADD